MAVPAAPPAYGVSFSGAITSDQGLRKGKSKWKSESLNREVPLAVSHAESEGPPAPLKAAYAPSNNC
jgi:hypothetical protein